MSAPAMKTPGLPERTRSARIRGSRETCRRTSPSSRITARETLLTFTPGRSNVRIARPSSSSWRSNALQDSGDMRFLGRLVHRGDQIRVALLEDPPLDLQRGSDGSVLDREIGGEERKGADLLVVRLVAVVFVDLALKQGSDLGIRVDRSGLEVDVFLRRVLLHPVELRHDQRRQ